MDDALNSLVKALRCLPGVGPRSAQRMVFHLLQHKRQSGLNLAKCLENAMESIKHCNRCNNFTTADLCKLCKNNKRDFTTICVVESPADVLAVEQSSAFDGSYFVLMGKISPIDGIGPEELKLSKLRELIIQENIKEVIMALSPTIEGQTTAHFIYELLRDHPVQISQLAHGIPCGGELEFLDGLTIGNALRNRAQAKISFDL